MDSWHRHTRTIDKFYWVNSPDRCFDCDVIVAGTNIEAESRDRANTSLPANQYQLIDDTLKYGEVMTKLYWRVIEGDCEVSLRFSSQQPPGIYWRPMSNAIGSSRESNPSRGICKRGKLPPHFRFGLFFQFVQIGWEKIFSRAYLPDPQFLSIHCSIDETRREIVACCLTCDFVVSNINWPLTRLTVRIILSASMAFVTSQSQGSL